MHQHQRTCAREEASLLLDPTISIGETRLPLRDFVVSRTGVLGITKSGKTFAAKGIAEQLLGHGIPIVVFDAIGVWRFLRTPTPGSADTGYPIVVVGGAQPDLPLTPDTAPAIVRCAARENTSLVVDLYDPRLSKADWRKIVQRCFRVLLYENTRPRHIFLEEAVEYAPQRVTDGETYGEVEKLARMGGNKGLGITMIAQRAQELNKAVLELCDNFVLLRQRGRNSIAALGKWLEQVSPSMSDEISESLPHLSQGDCWVWTEGTETPVRTTTAAIRSYHPDRRDAQITLDTQVTADAVEFVERLTRDLGLLGQQAVEDDPARLRARIRELERQLRTKGGGSQAAEVLARAHAAGLRQGRREARQRLRAAEEVRDRTVSDLDAIGVLVGNIRARVAHS